MTLAKLVASQPILNSPGKAKKNIIGMLTNRGLHSVSPDFTAVDDDDDMHPNSGSFFQTKSKKTVLLRLVLVSGICAVLYVGLNLNWIRKYFRFQKMFAEMGPVLPVGRCEMIDLGSGSKISGDGQKMACKNMFPDQRDCTIISLGSHSEWDFETDAFTKTNCVTHTFDCTGNFEPPANIASRTFFHKKCVADFANTEGEQPSVTWPMVLNMTGNRQPVHLKIDIEGWEWQVMHAIISGDPSLRPLQISMELHVDPDHHQLGAFIGVGELFRRLSDIGYDLLW
eukprot:CAMPEP_0175089242 /NCGR_PEP_ID=MMETSP0086_2-20121207/684_1 /TAXON_ID=136419 /ORGANISM="Unknown Unknown, Strain D1" /LENGTH=282 /DNA_ID=CAMNT_0016361743 /DNA_START=313 /DNA_END=1159 /DNA_ORIENTATION=+